MADPNLQPEDPRLYCAWCKVDMGPAGDGSLIDGHGMCPTCLEALRSGKDPRCVDPQPVRKALVELLRRKLELGQLGNDAQLRAASLTERFRRDVGLAGDEGRHEREGRTA